MKRARRCQELLQQAELRITRLQETFAEGLREEPEEYLPAEDPDVPQEEPPLE